MTRKLLIGGNWKMQASKEKVNDIVKMLNEAKLAFSDRDIVVAPSFPFLSHVKSILRKDIEVSAQNCCHVKSGAFTGEVSATMIKDLGLSWVILGHSERRHIFNETDQIIGKKIALAIEEGLNVIACIGETLDERKSEKTEAALEAQLTHIIGQVKDWSKVAIAYEPVWAIGTGIVASPDQAEGAHVFIRKYLKDKVSESVSNSVRIIYGGSVKADNVESLFKQPNIDGFLVGGASLLPDFISIINCPKN